MPLPLLRPLRVACAALALLGTSASCARETPASAEAQRGWGEKGWGENGHGGEPSRILSLAPSTTEILFAVGAGERVVGVDAFSDFPPAARRLPKLGGLLDANLEGMLRLRPDLAVLVPSQAEVARSFQAAGVATLTVPHESLEDVVGGIRAIGRRVGRADRAESLADSVGRTLERERVRIPEARRPRVLFVVEREPGQVAGFTAAGGRTYVDELIDLAGGRNVLRGSTVRYPQLSAESVLTLRPDVILEWSPGPPGATAADTREADRRRIEEWSRLTGLASVARGSVHVLHESLWMRPGPRVLEALVRLKRVVGAVP